MKRYAVWIVLLLATPALATISQRQSPVSQWNAGASSTCFATLGSTPIATDLFVVWSFWTYTPPNQLTAKVTDSFGNTFVSAVGPTLQTASNTFAQIFYVPNLSSGTGSDKLTVTYYLNGTITNANTSGCVFVEYQGADLNYPLDSVSAGYSSSLNPTSLLDSGTVAPANSNLLVFAGGISDGGTATAGTGFASIQSYSFTGGGSAITEQNSSAITGNNTLQRATACLAPLPCPTTPIGNWLMQMAVFRDASSTVAGGWPPARLGQILYASQFPGLDASAKIQNAIDACPPSGCTVYALDLSDVGGTGSRNIDPGGKLVALWLGSYTYNFSQITLRTGFEIIGSGSGGTVVQSSGGTFIQAQNGNNPVFVIPQTTDTPVQRAVIRDLQIFGSSGNISEDGLLADCSGPVIGNGLQYSLLENVAFQNFQGASIHLRGAPNNFQSGNQFDTFINVTVFRPIETSSVFSETSELSAARRVAHPFRVRI